MLAPGGVCVTKVFQGEGFDELFKATRDQFEKVLTRKPTASRPRSREVYLVARGRLVTEPGEYPSGGVAPPGGTS